MELNKAIEKKMTIVGTAQKEKCKRNIARLFMDSTRNKRFLKYNP